MKRLGELAAALIVAAIITIVLSPLVWLAIHLGRWAVS